MSGPKKVKNLTQGMTGFGSREDKVCNLGKIYVELKSINHKALEVVFRLPEGIASLEERIRREIEARISRGRITCSMNITGGQAKKIFVNKQLLKDYMSSMKYIRGQMGSGDQISLSSMVNLPGVLTLSENRALLYKSWPAIRALVRLALGNLVRSRVKEGRSLAVYSEKRIKNIRREVEFIRRRFKAAVKNRLSKIKITEEKAIFLKETDIAEELDRLNFHLKNFQAKLALAGPKGKELDFIAQEIQREANTIGAKAFDHLISSRVIRVKSQAEKMREQLQNME